MAAKFESVRRRDATACILCGAPPPLTGEHIFPDWYNRQQPNFRYELESQIDRGAVRRRSTQALNLKPKVLCSANKCNGAWGSKLESAVRPILTPMIRGESRDLQPIDAHLLAGWFFLKGMVAEYLAARDFRFFRLQDGQRLRAFLHPPDWSKIWIGSYVGERQNAGWVMDRVSAQQISANPPAMIGWYSTTYSIGQVAFHSITLTQPIPIGEVEPGQSVAFRFDWSAGDWDEVLSLIWPPPDEAIRWPPPKSLDDAGFLSLADRWSENVGPLPGTK